MQERRSNCQAGNDRDGAEGRHYATYQDSANLPVFIAFVSWCLHFISVPLFHFGEGMSYEQVPLFHFGEGMSYGHHVLAHLVRLKPLSTIGRFGAAGYAVYLWYIADSTFAVSPRAL
jgi:hypothetical protein